MKWLAKALLQKLFSGLPGGEQVNYFFQRHLAKTLPWGAEETLAKFGHALRHYRAACLHGRPAHAPRSAYEFGSGRELIVPMALYMLGVQRQVVVDLRPLSRPELVGHAARLLEGLFVPQTETELELLRPLPGGSAGDSPWLRGLGIDYQAPRDARATGLPPASFDLVSSTQVLEHVPRQELTPLLRECRRLVSPGGVVSLEIDMQDHLSYFDASLSVYHFLTLGERAWNLVNSGLHYQNRLRLPAYLEAVEEAGLEVLAQDITWPSEEDLDLLQNLRLAPDLVRGHDLLQLGARRAHLVCRPR